MTTPALVQVDLIYGNADDMNVVDTLFFDIDDLLSEREQAVDEFYKRATNVMPDGEIASLKYKDVDGDWHTFGKDSLDDALSFAELTSDNLKKLEIQIMATRSEQVLAVLVQVDLVCGEADNMNVVDTLHFEIDDISNERQQATEECYKRAASAMPDRQIASLKYKDDEGDWCTFSKDTFDDALSFGEPVSDGLKKLELQIMATRSEAAPDVVSIAGSNDTFKRQQVSEKHDGNHVKEQRPEAPPEAAFATTETCPGGLHTSAASQDEAACQEALALLLHHSQESIQKAAQSALQQAFEDGDMKTEEEEFPNATPEIEGSVSVDHVTDELDSAPLEDNSSFISEEDDWQIV